MATPDKVNFNFNFNFKTNLKVDPYDLRLVVDHMGQLLDGF